MCAIVDANVASEVFGSSPSPAGDRFFDWIERGSERLVVGGKLLEELETGSPGFREWARQAELSGTMRVFDESEVGERTEQIGREGIHTSDDPHVLALAQLSGARLLYSNDRGLRRDFKDTRLINNPAGLIYSTLRSRNFGRSHRQLLGRTDIC